MFRRLPGRDDDSERLLHPVQRHVAAHISALALHTGQKAVINQFPDRAPDRHIADAQLLRKLPLRREQGVPPEIAEVDLPQNLLLDQAGLAAVEFLRIVYHCYLHFDINYSILLTNIQAPIRFFSIYFENGGIRGAAGAPARIFRQRGTGTADYPSSARRAGYVSSRLSPYP